ncbi:MAG TPA: ClbS/DfsB family four-helix bundle protein, partial [Anaerolineales bacterium]|nr:ClbS/DfsB family four-helix bundle protein [Anaerolineales bacterium]
DWSIKDVIAHLWAWQQVSIARMEAGRQDRKPQYPQWILSLGADWEEDANRVNALTYETYHQRPWTEIYQTWKNGFIQFLDLGSAISERDLLDGDRYPWLKGYSLAFILVASYDHHQEHYEKLSSWLQKQ